MKSYARNPAWQLQWALYACAVASHERRFRLSTRMIQSRHPNPELLHFFWATQPQVCSFSQQHKSKKLWELNILQTWMNASSGRTELTEKLTEAFPEAEATSDS